MHEVRVGKSARHDDYHDARRQQHRACPRFHGELRKHSLNLSDRATDDQLRPIYLERVGWDTCRSLTVREWRTLTQKQHWALSVNNNVMYI